MSIHVFYRYIFKVWAEKISYQYLPTKEELENYKVEKVKFVS